MKKIILAAGLFLLASTAVHVQAQSINNKNWKAWIGEPINDTLTLTDQSTGEYSCPDATGKYKINLSGDSFTLTLIEDPCEGRAQALNGLKWIKASK